MIEIHKPGADPRRERDPIIAVVDDDEAFRSALKDYLMTFGYQGRLFSCAEDYLTFPEKDEVDCILTDVRMPGLSGLELQEVLLRNPRPCPLIFLTSYSNNKAMRDLAISRGAVAFLGKPVPMRELAQHIGDALGRSRGAQGASTGSP